MATMSCQGIKKDTHYVVVKFPRSLKARCGLYVRRCREGCSQLVVLFVTLFAILFLIAVWSSVVWVKYIVQACQITPMLALEDLSIRDLAVYQNITVSTPDLQWQVKSDFNVTLSAWNRNTVAGCFSTYRRMVVYVGYFDALILQQEVPLGFGLKPRRSRPVVVEVKGDHFPVKKELGQLLNADLRNASSVNLQFYFDTRVMRNDRKAEWIRMGCQVVAKTPLNSSQVGGNLLWKNCGPS